MSMRKSQDANQTLQAYFTKSKFEWLISIDVIDVIVMNIVYAPLGLRGYMTVYSLVRGVPSFDINISQNRTMKVVLRDRAR